jgi:hypothetical protein
MGRPSSRGQGDSHASITHHQLTSLVPLMLISYYMQWVSIAFQHVRANAIFQRVATFNHDSSSLPHIPTSWFVAKDAFLTLGLLLHYCCFDCFDFFFMCLHALYFMWMDIYKVLPNFQTCSKLQHPCQIFCTLFFHQVHIAKLPSWLQFASCANTF